MRTCVRVVGVYDFVNCCVVLTADGANPSTSSGAPPKNRVKGKDSRRYVIM